jgi:hypothetical protein
MPASTVAATAVHLWRVRRRSQPLVELLADGGSQRRRVPVQRGRLRRRRRPRAPQHAIRVQVPAPVKAAAGASVLQIRLIWVAWLMLPYPRVWRYSALV